MDDEPEVIDVADQIDRAWVGSVLGVNGVGAPVETVTSAPVGTGQMGATHRVTVHLDGEPEPMRLIVKLPVEPGVQSMTTLGQRCEVGFYQEAAARLSIGLPRCYHAAQTDEGARFTIVLEDASPAAPGDQIAGCTVEQATAAASNLGGLHAPTWCDPTIEEFDWVVSGRPDEAGADFLGSLVIDAAQQYIDTMAPPSGHAEVLHHFAERSARWARGRSTPFALTHGDYRLDNLLFPPDDRPLDPVIAIDWGVVSVGLPHRDVALLVAPGLEIDVRRDSERTIVEAYHASLLEHGVADYDAVACWEDYRYGLFYSLLQTALGWAYSGRTERGDRMFRLLLERAVASVLDNDALELLDD